MNVIKDICNESQTDYIKENKITDKFTEDNKKIENYAHTEESKIYINCNLKAGFDTRNKMIYLYPGKSQYFTMDVSKCCGNLNIKYKGHYQSKGISGNLGIYHIVQSGIIVKTHCKLDPHKMDILTFTAIDECTKECCDFVVVFSCNSRCCCC
ncbi:hypothetical protein psyc5s11_27520 [Clostridium gelidum]|uniref:Uncharacterized protein n=1 Tax=Clostridium gelidum TaxID=704125 RepID=A0ABM7T408_9CLOT|nr:hypothetical protein [Clostridium gelidum]BCZ46685.1 hypothetical protein psyc5s11_27520 [Clostridium gelidum]